MMHPYEAMLLDLAQKDPRVVIMTAETRFSMRNIPDILNERFVDVGISEMNLIGSAAGMAKMGKLPICHALAAFLTMRPFEFIRSDLGYANLKAVLVGSFNGFISQANGPTHQAIDDIGLMRVIPNMTVVAPKDIREMSLIMNSLDNLQGPMYVRYNDQEAAEQRDQEFAWGKNECLVKGSKVAVLSYGLILHQCLAALPQLEKDGITPSVYNMRFLEPMDTGLLKDILSRYRHIVVVEDHYERGGLNSIVVEHAWREKSKASIHGINLGKTFFKPALLDEAMEVAGFSPEKIAHSVLSFVQADDR